MRMKALQDSCVASEGVIRRLQKRQDIQNKEMDQYKEVVHTLNKELTVVTETLKQESILREKAKEAKANLEVELTTIYGLVEMARVNTIAEFKASQPFIDACVVYYGDGFKDFLKQVGFVYPNLDLSKVTMDDPMPTTPTFSDTINEETDDSTHIEQDLKDDSVVLAQPTLEKLVTPLVSSAEDPHAHDALNFTTQDASNSFAQDAHNLTAQDASNV